LLVDAFGYTLSDVEQFQQNACASAFIPAEDRDELAEVISQGFENAVRGSRS
jgi:adenosine deaminase